MYTSRGQGLAVVVRAAGDGLMPFKVPLLAWLTPCGCRGWT